MFKNFIQDTALNLNNWQKQDTFKKTGAGKCVTFPILVCLFSDF